MLQPGASPLPVAFDRAGRNTQGLGRLFFRQPGEEPALDHARQPLVDLPQAVEGGVDRERVGLLVDGDLDAVESWTGRSPPRFWAWLWRA